MESNTVYIVETFKGYFEDSVKILVGIYSTMWNAERAREAYLIELNILNNKYTKEQCKQYDEEIDEWEDSGKNIADLPNYLKEYEDWEYVIQPFSYSNQVTIKEVELDKRQYKIGE